MDIIEKAQRAGRIAEQINNLKAELEALFGNVTLEVPSSLEATPVTVEPVAEAAPAATEQKRRGRPPGSPNKPKAPPVDPTPTPVVSESQGDDIPWGGDGETENVTEATNAESATEPEDVF